MVPKGKQRNKITTIKLTRTTKSRLEKLKSYKRETYDEILEKILEILNISRISPERARARLISIDRQNKKTNRKNIIQKQNPQKIRASSQQQSSLINQSPQNKIKQQ